MSSARQRGGCTAAGHDPGKTGSVLLLKVTIIILFGGPHCNDVMMMKPKKKEVCLSVDLAMAQYYDGKSGQLVLRVFSAAFVSSRVVIKLGAAPIIFIAS